MAAVEHLYRYPRASGIDTDGPRLVGRFEGSLEPAGAACFFRGRLVQPRATAQCLRALAKVVMTRFYTPPAMLQRILAEADPVVTAGREMLRFEGFSACCSTYARLDLEPGAFEAETLSCGTTNVDFQAPMRAALAKVTDASQMTLVVGSDAVAVTIDDDQVVERKVVLPVRWIKGLAEVQAHLARMQHRFTVPRSEALRFLRALPRGATRHTSWVTSAGRGLRLTQRASAGSVRITATERLRVLEELVLLATQLRIHTDDASGASAWVLDIGTQRFTFVLSPERWRGFSGEGQLLEALSQADATALLARVQGALSWQDALVPTELASALDAEPEAVERSLTVLAAHGLVGFDLERGAFFHRVLPFDLSLVESLHPRLKDARKLVDKGGVELQDQGGVIVATVRGPDVTHRVRLARDGVSCTCPWYAKHQGDRGPCKHVLAAQIVTEGGDA